ncbi:MAG: hypothetical protein PVI80_18170, partial [Anaerolineae bacterium]
RLKELEYRLARHTVDKIVRIVELLARGRAEELAVLLLQDEDEAPDNQHTLRAKLSQDGRTRIAEAERALRIALQAGDLAEDTDLQRAWLEEFFSNLAAIPMDTLSLISRERTGYLTPLIQVLERFASSLATPSPGLDALRGELSTQPRDLSWPELLDTLHRGLERLIEQGDGGASWPDLLKVLAQWIARVRSPFAMRAVVEGVDPTDLAQAGWGIIFAHEDPRAGTKVPAIKEALQPLLDLRQSQAGAHFKVYEGEDGYRPNETASRFVARHGARVSDPADPQKVPYYLLILGSPEEIPFHFQYQLDVQYAVGRIDFGDDMDAYANYARSIVTAETEGANRAPRVTFFGVSNPGDRATKLSAEHLVDPLHKQIGERYGGQWQVDAVLREEAKKAKLLRLLGGAETPALLFAACHGIEFPKEAAESRQAKYQGALLCQEWPGPGVHRGEIPRDHYLAGDDLGGDADLQGLIAFFFACYSAGTPRFDEYTKQAFLERRQTITERPFVAALPKSMLGLSKGALAVVGHVERAWGLSYLGDRQSRQIAVFASAVERLLKGHPIGSAMEFFNGRYAALSTELTAAIQKAERWDTPLDPYELAQMWTANNDARGYIVVGDPAVRLPQNPANP